MNTPMIKNEYALPFAAWELRLYLDTHPNDEKAFNAYKQICAAQGVDCNCDLRSYNNTKAGRMSTVPSCGCNAAVSGKRSENLWRWIDGPWPWEYEANVNGGRC